jgi:hypothetical protein
MNTHTEQRHCALFCQGQLRPIINEPNLHDDRHHQPANEPGVLGVDQSVQRDGRSKHTEDLQRHRPNTQCCTRSKSRAPNTHNERRDSTHRGRRSHQHQRLA